MKHLYNILLIVMGTTTLALAAKPTCDMSLYKITKNPNDKKESIAAIDSCITYLEEESPGALHNEEASGNTYCKDNPKNDILSRMINFFVRLSLLEKNTGSFCCSKEQCTENCSKGLVSTCDPNGKPHDVGLLTTTETPLLAQNLASRLIALANTMKVQITRGTVTPDKPKQPPTTNGDKNGNGIAGPPTVLGGN